MLQSPTAGTVPCCTGSRSRSTEVVPALQVQAAARFLLPFWGKAKQDLHSITLFPLQITWCRHPKRYLDTRICLIPIGFENLTISYLHLKNPFHIGQCRYCQFPSWGAGAGQGRHRGCLWQSSHCTGIPQLPGSHWGCPRLHGRHH